MFKRLIVSMLSICTLMCLTACTLRGLINTPDESSKETIKFDLSQYYSHGELRCGLVWVVKETSNWDSEKEYHYAYFDAEGNIKSPWFEGSYPSNFTNNYVIIKTHEKDYSYYTVYDTSFKELCHTPPVNGFTEIWGTDIYKNVYIRATNHDADRDVYEQTLYWIDTDGLHEFERVSQLDFFDDFWAIDSSNGFFVIVNYRHDPHIGHYTTIACIFDRTGKFVLDIQEALEEQSKIPASFDVKSAEVIANNCIKVFFYGVDNKLYVATMNFDGEFIGKPTVAK
ncbi:MAG: hypothetical protein J6D09_04650 [Clostridia bacterium]|nr:hypothetical protein [Clostridia bacterium]